MFWGELNFYLYLYLKEITLRVREYTFQSVTIMWVKRSDFSAIIFKNYIVRINAVQ